MCDANESDFTGPSVVDSEYFVLPYSKVYFSLGANTAQSHGNLPRADVLDCTAI